MSGMKDELDMVYIYVCIGGMKDERDMIYICMYEWDER